MVQSIFITLKIDIFIKIYLLYFIFTLLFWIIFFMLILYVFWGFFIMHDFYDIRLLLTSSISLSISPSIISISNIMQIYYILSICFLLFSLIINIISSIIYFELSKSNHN
jgi:hypothetical protein